MATQTVILDPQLISSLSLTPDSIAQAGLWTGVAVNVSLEPGKITLQKTDPREELALLRSIIDESREQSSERRSNALESEDRPTTAAIERLQGLFAGQPSLEEEYYRNKDVDKW
jgi:hypothetical protein